MSITFEFLGAAGTVTGSKHLVTIGGKRLLIDCGLFQGLKELRLRNWEPLPLDVTSIDMVLLTHAHIDHTGYLPRLVADGYRGPIIATRATAALAAVLLPDSGRLQEEDARYHAKRGSSKHQDPRPLYTESEAIAAAARVVGVPYNTPVDIAPGLTATFRRAGHILGASSIHLVAKANGGTRTVVCSGDIGRYDAPILPDPAPVGDADAILVESTYGDRTHDAEAIPAALERLIKDAHARGGAIIVPAFALGRTQELMYHLALLEDAGRIPRMTIYVDSPMAISATQIYKDHPEDFDADMAARVASGDSPLESSDFRLTRSVEQSRAINKTPGVFMVISASGMATGGRILHHLKNRLADERTTVLLVGYQAAGTRGRAIQQGADRVKIFGEYIPVKAKIETIHGLSAHADKPQLLRWLSTATHAPERVFVVHGEPEPAESFAATIQTSMHWDAVAPKLGERFDLA